LPLGGAFCDVLGFADGDADAPGDAGALPDAVAEGPPLGPAVAAVAAAPEGAAESPPDGSSDDGPPGLDACRGCGSCVDTPGCRIGAIGGFLGSGCGVRPDTHA
jgi:hypothetical protein